MLNKQLRLCLLIAIHLIVAINCEDEQQVEVEPEPIRLGSSTGNFISGEYYKRTYADINNYLVEHVPNDEASLNFLAANEWLEKENSKGLAVFKSNLLAALKQFTALNGVSGRCDVASLNILMRNDLATNARKIEQSSSRRIEYIVHQYCLEHAKQCRAIDRDAFVNFYTKQVVESSVNAIEILVNSFWSLRRFNGPVKNKCAELSKLFIFNKAMKGIKEKRVAFNTLTQIAFEDHKSADQYLLLPRLDPESNKLKIYKGKFAELYYRYFVSPCAQVLNQLKPTIQSGLHNAFWFLKANPNDCNEEDAKFYTTLAGYKICERLIKKDKEKLLNNLMNLAENMKSVQDEPPFYH